MGTLKNIYSGIRNVIRHEGFLSLISRGFAYLKNRIFVFEDYYIVNASYKDADKENEADYRPKTSNCCWKAISTNRDADELLEQGFTFGAYEINLRASLDKGATALCIFVDKELGHLSCFTDNPRSKHIVDPLPFEVDFKNGYIAVGKALTIPKFRRLHLRIYNGHVLRKMCWGKGIKGARYTLRANNYPALAIAAQPPYKEAVSRCRYIKILFFKFFKENKMGPTPFTQIYKQISNS